MRSFTMVLAALALMSCAACGSDPLAGVAEAMKKGDHAGALAIVEQAKRDKPESPQAHFQALLLYRLLSAQGDPRKQAYYDEKGLDEYRWIISKTGAQSNYTDIEGSLKASDKTKAEFDKAYASVYAR